MTLGIIVGDKDYNLINEIHDAEDSALSSFSPIKGQYKFKKDEAGKIVITNLDGTKVDKKDFDRVVNELKEKFKQITPANAAAKNTQLLNIFPLVGRPLVQVGKGSPNYDLIAAAASSNPKPESFKDFSFHENAGVISVLDEDGKEVEKEVFDAALNDLRTELETVDIFTAAQVGNTQLLNACMLAGRQVLNATDWDGKTALHHAAENGHKSTCEFLLDNGADIFAVYAPIVTNPDTGDEERGAPRTALSDATGAAEVFLAERREKIAKRDYAKFAPNEQDGDRMLAVFYKMADDGEFSDRDGFKYMIKNDGDDEYEIVGVDENGDELELEDWQVGYALNNLARNEFHRKPTKESLEACLIVGMSSNEEVHDGNNSKIIHYAALFGDKKVCELLINSGADIHAPRADGANALMLAAHQNKKDVCELLINNGLSISARDNGGNTALYYAENIGSVDAANLIRGKIESEGKKMYEGLAAPGPKKNEILKSYYEFLGGDHKFTDHNGYEYQVNQTTSVSGEVSFDIVSTDPTRTLEPWEVGYAMTAFGTSRTNYRGRPNFNDFIVEALREGNLATIQSCLNAGTSVNYSNPRFGAGLLHYAAWAPENSKEICEDLVTRGVDVSAVDNHGKTALYGARSAGNVGVADFLAAELEKKRGAVKLDPKKREEVLKEFFGNDTNGVFVGQDGEYSIEKTGDIFSVSVLMGDGKGGPGTKKALTDQQLDNALGDIGKGLAYTASRSKNPTLLQACNDVLASSQTARIRKNNPAYDLINAANKSKTRPAAIQDLIFITDGKTGVVTVLDSRGNEVTKEKVDEAVAKLTKELETTNIFAAANRGDAQLLNACILAGRSVATEKDVDGKTALHYAAKNDHKTTCEFLVNKGADIFATYVVEEKVDGVDSFTLHTALHDAKGDAQTFLTKKRKEFSRHHYAELAPKPDKKDEVLGVFFGILSENSADEDLEEPREFTDPDGFRYQIIIDGDEFDIVGLDEKDQRVTLEDWQIGYALNSLGKRVAFEEIKAFKDLDPEEKTEHLEDLKTILNNCIDVGVSVNDKNPNGNGYSLFHESVAVGNADVCDFLIASGANLNATIEKGRGAISIAAEHGHLEVCQLLLKSGFGNTLDSEGHAAAYYAQEKGHTKVTDFFREKYKGIAGNKELGKDKDKKNKILKAFHSFTAAEDHKFTDPDGIEYRIKQNAADSFDIERIDGTAVEDWEAGYAMKAFPLSRKGGVNFYSKAVGSGDIETVRACLDTNHIPANYRLEDPDNKTILHHAAAGGDDESSNQICQELLGRGASILLPDKERKTALFYAREKGNVKTANFLAEKLAEKRAPVRLTPEKRLEVLQTFFDSNPSGSFDGFDGRYSIKKDGNNFSVFVTIAGKEEKLEGEKSDNAIGDIGRSLIFSASRSGDVDLIQACFDVGASTVALDKDYKRPITYAKTEDNREASRLITQKHNQSHNKFHELAILVKEAKLAGKAEQDIQKTVEDFSAGNPELKLSGLRAKDLLVFMDDLTIRQSDGTPAIAKPIEQRVKNATRALGGGGVDELNKALFHLELFITCLEDQRFISDEEKDSIKSLIQKEVAAVPNTVSRDFGYAALMALKKDTVLGHYCQSRFAQLKNREGLDQRLTYDQFAKGLGEVVKITYGVDHERQTAEIAARQKSLDELRAQQVELVKAVNDPDRRPVPTEEERNEVARNAETIKAREKTLKDLQDSLLKEKETPQHIRALNALLGSADENRVKGREDIPNRDLRIALDMMRAGEEITPANVLNKIAEEEKAAAAIIKKFHREFGFRRNVYEPDTFAQAKENVEKLLGLDLEEAETDFDLSDERKIKRNEFEANYQSTQIPEIKGSRIYDGNTGLVINEYDGVEGLHRLTQQIEKATARHIPKDAEPEVSVAIIRAGEGFAKDMYCVATSNSAGTTKTFAEDISPFTKRSEEIYTKNLQYLTDRQAVESAISVFTEIQGEILAGSFVKRGGSLAGLPDAEKRYADISKELRGQLQELRKCLLRSEPNQEGDTPEQREQKAAAFYENFNKFKNSPQGKKFEEIISKKADPLLVAVPNINQKLEQVNKLYNGQSDKQQRQEARQTTSRQISKEIAQAAKSAEKENKAKNDLDAKEVDNLIDRYRSSSVTQYRVDKGELRKLLEADIPTPTLPNSISILRPKNLEGGGHFAKGVATVVFNGLGGDDTAYLAVPESNGACVKVTRCDSDGKIAVWRDGKEVMEDHKAGDVVIHSGVVFRKDEKGKFGPIPIKELKGVAKESALDFRVKAISIDDKGNRCSVAALYGGSEIHGDLAQKTSYHGKENAAKGEEKYDAVIRHQNGNLLKGEDNKRVVAAEAENFKILVDLHFSTSDNKLYAGNDTKRGVIEYIDAATGKKETLSLRRDGFDFIEPEAEKKLMSLLSGQSEEKRNEFLGKFLSASELRAFEATPNSTLLCRKIANYCDQLKVGVALQEVKQNGTKDGKPVYENVGSPVPQTYELNKKFSREEEISVAHKEAASLASALVSSLFGPPKPPSPRIKDPKAITVADYLLNRKNKDVGVSMPPPAPTGVAR